MGAGYHGGFGNTKGSRNPNSYAAGTVKLVKAGIGEEFGKNASKAKPKKGYTDVIIHGNPNTGKVAVFHNGKWRDIDQRRLATYVKQSSGYKSGPIRLMSCNAGEKDFAQNFANKMGVEVIAPSTTIWASATGKIVVGSAPYRNDGKWLKFKPNKGR